MTDSRPAMMRLPHKITFYPTHMRQFYGFGSVSRPAVVQNTIYHLIFAGVVTFGVLHLNRKKASGGKEPKTFSPEWKAAEAKKSAARKADPIQEHVKGTKL